MTSRYMSIDRVNNTEYCCLSFTIHLMLRINYIQFYFMQNLCSIAYHIFERHIYCQTRHRKSMHKWKENIIGWEKMSMAQRTLRSISTVISLLLIVIIQYFKIILSTFLYLYWHNKKIKSGRRNNTRVKAILVV